MKKLKKYRITLRRVCSIEFTCTVEIEATSAERAAFAAEELDWTGEITLEPGDHTECGSLEVYDDTGAPPVSGDEVERDGPEKDDERGWAEVEAAKKSMRVVNG